MSRQLRLTALLFARRPLYICTLLHYCITALLNCCLAVCCLLHCRISPILDLHDDACTSMRSCIAAIIVISVRAFTFGHLLGAFDITAHNAASPAIVIRCTRLYGQGLVPQVASQSVPVWRASFYCPPSASSIAHSRCALPTTYLNNRLVLILKTKRE